ncbi:hypothetical protein BO99DRAFT_216811 [Aspergillus violaceofuscus CBS 115571]|uniref:Uncharacterized protein n=1 Tax=Aspergillus violaceofuscus (strain CBS 115571) TaxID=1450538 RepID=A0A2V5HXU3_ASPV1|nr:hypothetical protein BO99DRAFT_216811 [Aspergillus violaceofuscus CBS 115571]
MSAPSSNSPRDDPVASSSTTLPRSQTNSTADLPHHTAADDSDDYTSSSGPSDSEEEESDDEDARATATEPSPPRPANNPAHKPSAASAADTTIPRIPALPKPNIHRVQQTPDLLSRLSAFLPQMKTANEQLERDIAAGRAKDIRLDDAMDEDEDEDEGEGEDDGQADGKRYIEMVGYIFSLLLTDGLFVCSIIRKADSAVIRTSDWACWKRSGRTTRSRPPRSRVTNRPCWLRGLRTLGSWIP